MNTMTQWLNEDLVYALGWTFFHSIWQASLIALVLAFALQLTPVKKANTRYQISILSLFSVLVAALCTFIYYYGSYTDSVSSKAMITYIGGVESEAGATTFFAQISSWQQTLESYLPLIVAIWISGMVVFAIRLIGGVAYIQHIRRTAQSIGAPYTKRVQSFQKRLKFKKPIHIASSAWANVPMVIGHIKPLILFPIGAINQLTPQELEAILAHEIAHISRFDYLQNIIQSLIEIIFYYHPAIWWISSVIRNERENTCDDIAIQLCGNSMTYAKALVQLQSMQHRTPALAMPLFKSKGQLLMRIKRILNQPYNKSNTMEKLIATTVCLVCFMMFTMSATKSHVEKTTDLLAVSETNALEHSDIKAQSVATLTIVDFALDTVPKAKSRTKTKISKYTDEQHVEILMENGEIQELKIDGKTIPKDQYGEYEEQIEDMTRESESSIPPPPPHSPKMHQTPDAPSTPPHPPHAKKPNEPPHPPHTPEIPGAPKALSPPLPPPPPSVHFFNKKGSAIIHEIDEDGKRVIKIERKGLIGDDDVEIIVDGDVLVIDGDEIRADTIIMDGDNTFWFRGDSFNFPKFNYDFKNDFNWNFEADSILFKGNKHWFGIMKDGDNEEILKWYSEGEGWPENFEFDKEKLYEHFFENKEEMKEKLLENQEELQKHLFENQKRIEGQLFEQREDMKNQLYEKQRKNEKYNKQYKEAQKHYKDAQSKLYRELEIEKQSGYERADKDRNRAYNDAIRRYNDSAYKIIGGKFHQNALLNALIKDDLIDADGNYSVKLTEKKLKINGEKMPSVLHKKYKRIYENQSGKASSGDLNVEFTNKESD